MKRFSILLSVILCLAGLAMTACGEKGGAENNGSIDVQFRVPEEATVDFGARTFDFRVQFGKAPLESDKIVFENSLKKEFVCDIISVTSKSFTVSLFDGIVSDSYNIYIKRGKQSKMMGTMSVTISGDGVEPATGSTVYGKISCDGNGVADVVVSDGFEVVRTDQDGIYQLQSKKQLKYVFMSVPSGYEPAAEGVLPKIYAALTKSSLTAERADFVLTKVDDQDKYKVFFLGDMHLANRTNDLTQFTVFTNELNNYMDSHKSEKMYAITLGDMTWDIYWYSNKYYKLPDYVQDINKRLSGILIYHTMGNHDNDMNAIGNWNAKIPYVDNIAPDYYSFNIGKVHYIVVDDIDCKNYKGGDRDYVKALPQEQIDWLKKDLQYVDKSTPLIITTHAQIFYPNGSKAYKIDHDASSTKALFDAVKGYKVHYVTGHTHTIFNALPSETASLGATDTYEHNAGAICASWWWSGNLTDGVYVSLDGAPGGYSVWDINGTDMRWRYKATAKDESYQFRSYDLNNVSFSYDDVPELTDAAMKLVFAKYVNAYSKSQSNEVLINIWNWSSDWTLKVTDETGKELEYTKCAAYDPLHVKALTVKRFNKANVTSTPSFVTENKMPHFFKVKADNAEVDLTITVTDSFGNVYKENMARPKAFNALTDAQLKAY